MFIVFLTRFANRFHLSYFEFSWKTIHEPTRILSDFSCDFVDRLAGVSAKRHVAAENMTLRFDYIARNHLEKHANVGTVVRQINSFR